MIEFIDTHLHLDASEFDVDRSEVVARAAKAGVGTLITIGSGYGIKSAERALKIAEEYNNIFASVGVHPNDSEESFDFDFLDNIACNKKIVAIGETGLDFYRNRATKMQQELVFRTQIELALKVKKPLIIHSRNAGEECLSILREMKADSVGGVFHCYPENHEFAARLANLGFFVSFTGVLTFKKADETRNTAAKIPLNQILIETDAPFLAPEPHRGKRCESAYMVETAKALAVVKGLSLEEVAVATCENARRLFDLNK